MELHGWYDRVFFPDAGPVVDSQVGARAMSRRKSPSPLTGRWRIVSMSGWEQDFIDEEDEAYFEFDDRGGGKFHFGYVGGWMDCRVTTRDGKPAVEWTWEGTDELDLAHDRGWAVLRDGDLHGMIFIRGTNDAEFVAKPKKTSPKRK